MAEAPSGVLLRVCAATFVAYCSYSICRAPLLPLFARELGADPPLIGFVMGASTLTGIFVKLPAGAWSDVLGRRPLLLAGAVVFATLPFTYLAVSALTGLVFLRFVHGSATAIFGPVAVAGLSDVAPPTGRGAWLSAYSTAEGAGQALGPVLAGYLIGSSHAGLVVCSTAVLLIPTASGLTELVAVIMVYAAGVATTTAATSAFITEVTRRARYGAAHGVFGTLYDVGDALGPIAGGFLVAAFGYARMFEGMGLLVLVMAIGFAVASKAQPIQ